MKIFSFLTKNLKNIENKYILIFYIFYLTLTLLISIIFSYLFLKQFPEFFYDNEINIIIKKIPFGYGNLLNNLFENNSYANTEEFFIVQNNQIIANQKIDFVLKKLPFFSFLLYFLLSISKNIFVIVIIKNLLFFSIFFFITYFSLKSLKLKFYHFCLIIFFFIGIPYNIKTFSEISYADSISSILLACLFLSLISHMNFKYVLSGLILFLLYLTKESMFVICIFIPLLIVILNFKKNKIKSFIPVIFVSLAMFSWGIFGFIKTGGFPFAQSISTWKSYDMSKSIDEDFSKYYPKLSTDNLDSNKIKKELLSEWDFYYYYKNENYYKIINKPSIVLKNIYLKIKFLLLNIYPDGISYEKKESYDILFILTSITNKLCLYLATILSFFFLFYTKSENKYELYFLSILIFNLSTHLIGWATTKHLVGISLVSFIYLIIKSNSIYLILNKMYKKIV